MQPKTDAADLAAAILEFEEKLPGWWWSVGVCSVSRDASCGPYSHCGPDRAGPDAHLLAHRIFDEGFDHDDRNGTVADSLRAVMKAALEAKERHHAA